MKTSKSLATKFVAGEPYSSSRFCGKIIQKHSYNWAKIQKEHLQLYYAIAARLLMIIIANENKRSFSFCDILRNQPRDYRQKSQDSGILLWKLFWPTVRKEMFLRSRMFSWDHKNNFFDQEQVRKWYFVDFELWNFFLKIFIEQNYKIILKSNFISCWLKVCDFTYWMKDRSLESWKVLH